MWTHSLDPVLVHLGPLEIRWYGLVYVLGFLFAAWLLHKYRSHLNMSKDEVWDLMLYVILGVLIGSRVFEVFWEPRYYLSNPLNFFKVWQGGMSFHGGFVGIIAGVWLYARKTKRSFSQLADIISMPAMLALAFGRIANFVNGELWGTVADQTKTWWCVNFKNTGGQDLCRHPQQLYAATYRFMIAGWLWFLLSKNKFRTGQVTSVRDQHFSSFRAGFLFWNFVLLEGIGRFIVDFWREDTLWGPLTIGQWFSAAMVVVAVVVMIRRYKDDWKKITQK
ncbi:prolipoprotein diacylglyceryl transferase [Candidatus Woesearchaeota archaeon]|nr:prolipoprotein diacylglyceryl transferase [Candidatus Woesearchaeota archaeon]